MALSTQPYKGTRDFYPVDKRIQNWMFNHLRATVETFGFQEYDGPMLEPFELYAAKSGEELVNQQLYWLVDRGERKMAIRPEMTPTLARMVAGKIQELPKPIRWFSIPNLWRYERPQRGRLREHWQLNVDVLGGDSLLADAEVLQLAYELMRAFGGEKHIRIKLNNRRLVDYFFTESLGLSPEVALATMKAVDAKAKISPEAYTKWLTDLGQQADQISRLDSFFNSSFEDIAKILPCPGVDELRQVFRYLEESGLGAVAEYDPSVMRGMNYYTGTVFEIYDTSPENRRAMFGGGRYDNLVGMFGNHKLSGVGFGMGDVTLRDFLETHQLLPALGSGVDVFVTLPKAEHRGLVERLAAAMRAQKLRVITPLEVDGFGAQLKQASKHGARFAVILGDQEIAQGQVMLKDLKSGQQKAVAQSDLSATIARDISG